MLMTFGNSRLPVIAVASSFMRSRAWSFEATAAGFAWLECVARGAGADAGSPA
jgi:hypothetical protein